MTVQPDAPRGPTCLKSTNNTTNASVYVRVKRSKQSQAQKNARGKRDGIRRGSGDEEVGTKTRQKGGGSVRALCHDACPCTCARPMPTHFCYAPCFVAGADFEPINLVLWRYELNFRSVCNLIIVVRSN